MTYNTKRNRGVLIHNQKVTSGAGKGLNVDIQNVFGEKEPLCERFSTFVITALIFHVLVYWALTKHKLNSVQCRSRLPVLSSILTFIVAHLLQTVIVYKYYGTSPLACWAIYLVPAILFILWYKYYENDRLKEAEELEKYRTMIRKRLMPNTSQLFSQDTTATGLQNQILKTQADNSSIIVPPQNLHHSQVYDVIPQHSTPTYNDYVASQQTSMLQPYDRLQSMNPFSNTQVW